jgi:hypothetical protein
MTRYFCDAFHTAGSASNLNVAISIEDRRMHRRISAGAMLCAAALLLNQPTARAACALPYQITNGQVADAAPVMSNFAGLLNCLNTLPGGAPNALQFNAGNGALSGVGPLTDGQLAIGSTNGPPQAATLTPGPGVTITNSPGSITIGTGGTGSDNGSDAPFTPPVLANMSWMLLGPGGQSAVQDGNYINLSNPANNNYVAIGLPVTSSNFTVTVRIRPSPIALNYQVQGIVLASSALTASRVQMLTAIFTNGLSNEWSYWNPGWGFDHAGNVKITYGAAIWLRIVSTPSGNSFYISQNGRVWTQTGSDNNSWIGATIAYAGVMCGSGGSGYAANITIDSFQITYP